MTAHDRIRLTGPFAEFGVTDDGLSSLGVTKISPGWVNSRRGWPFCARKTQKSARYAHQSSTFLARKRVQARCFNLENAVFTQKAAFFKVSLMLGRA
jgi:hypothetical protein